MRPFREALELARYYALDPVRRAIEYQRMVRAGLLVPRCGRCGRASSEPPSRCLNCGHSNNYCPVHTGTPEPCPTCESYIAAGL